MQVVVANEQPKKVKGFEDGGRMVRELAQLTDGELLKLENASKPGQLRVHRNGRVDMQGKNGRLRSFHPSGPRGGE
eukprot:3478554-Prorocentrum_lima.AAC.1